MEKIGTIIIGFLKFLRAIIIVALYLAIVYNGIDFVFKSLLSDLSRAVLANFVVFSSVIIYLSQKQVHPVKVLEEAQKTVTDSIMESETVKVRSEERLSSIEDSIAHIEDEIDAIIEKSEENAKLVGEKILQDAKNTALVIKENTGKAIENSRVILKNELLKRASLASVEVAKGHILNELNNNKELHDKLIDESIEAIEVVSAGVNEGENK